MKSVMDDVTIGSGNVFADLGFDNAEELQANAWLTYQIHTRLKEQGITQAEAGKWLGLKRPDVVAFMKCRTTDFSTDELMALLAKINQGA